MPKILEVILLVVIPVVWGLLIHCVFEMFRGRRVRRDLRDQSVEAKES
jgi:hypothetical protein